MDRRSARVVTGLVAMAVAVTACAPAPTPTPTTVQPTSEPTAAPTSAPGARKGGTIYILTQYEQLNFLDPQRVYTGDDLAFLGATIYRSLVSYAYSADTIEGTTLTPDLATDLGRPSDGGRTWSFTLRDGVTFQTGEPITCEDVKYGVSRTFADDVINQGPTYAIHHLDIPANPVTDPEDPRSQHIAAYYGPYDGTGQDLFDKAVECSADQRTITFHLKRPVGDFNYTTTLGFFPVPKVADTGETYGTTSSLPVSSGPYQVERYTVGKDGRLVLVRNPNWNPASDPIRKAYPDRWEVEFTVDLNVMVQRLIAAEGNDAYAISDATLGYQSLRQYFATPETPLAAISSRSLSGPDPYSRYLWIDVERVPDLKVRQAMLVALDRQAILELFGGPFAGTLADGVVNPNIGLDYAPTGIWDDAFGQAIPPSGDAEVARRLVAEAGASPGPLIFKFADTPINQRFARIVVDSLARAGLTVRPDPYCTGYGCGIIAELEPGEFGTAGWGADWPNASTVIPPLFTRAGGWDLSQVDDPAFNAAVEDALATLDRAEQARKWQALNRLVVENAWIIPTTFGRRYLLAGTNVRPIYQWPAFVSWPYGEMYVTP